MKLCPETCGNCRFLNSSQKVKRQVFGPDVSWHEVESYICELKHDYFELGDKICNMGIRLDDE